MSHERIARLIPDYLLDALDPVERKEVETHVRSCSSCAALLETARELRAGLRTAGRPGLLGHVQAQHLDRFARDPDAVEPRLAAWIRSHLDECAPCREALEILDSVHRAEASAARRPVSTHRVAARERGGAWFLLSRTVLHPVAALGYLALLAILVGVWSLRPAGTPARPAIEALPPAFPLYPQETLRAAESREPPEVAEIPGAETGPWLYLQVATLADEDLLQDAAVGFVVEIRDAGTTVRSQRLARSAVSEYGIVLLRVVRAGLTAGHDYRLVVQVAAPGRPRDGEVVFDRLFRIGS